MTIVRSCLLAAAALLLAACAGARPALQPPKPETLRVVQALAPYPCNGVTASVLDAYGVDPGRINSILYTRAGSGGEAGVLISQTAWVRVSGEPQYLIVHDAQCRFSNLTRG